MKIEEGFFVVDMRGTIGLVSSVPNKRHAVVQYGPNGPFSSWHQGSLRYATEQEVKDAGLHGVGGQVK